MLEVPEGPVGPDLPDLLTCAYSQSLVCSACLQNLKSCQRAIWVDVQSGMIAARSSVIHDMYRHLDRWKMLQNTHEHETK